MKKILYGRLFDTNTAEIIGSCDNGYDSNNIEYCSETLYKKTTGEYFLLGEGGAMSRYCEFFGERVTGGKMIIPYTEEEAKEWAIGNMSADAYMELFGPVAE